MRRVIYRTFKIYNQFRSYNMALLGSVILCLPMVGIIYGMRNEAADSNISFNSRAGSVIALGWLNIDFSEKQMLGFLEKVEDENYRGILGLFGDKVSFDSSLNLVDTEYCGMIFATFHSRSYQQDRVNKFITHIGKLMKDKNLGLRFVQNSYSFFSSQKVDATYIEQLVGSDNPYEQPASLYLAKSSFSQESLSMFYLKNKSLFDQYALNDRNVERSIASENK